MFRFLNVDLKKLVLIVLVLALPILSINLQRGPGEPAWYSKPFAYLAGGVQGAYTGFSEGVKGTVSFYLNLVGIKKENRFLAQENSGLRASLLEMGELKAEVSRLRKMLEFHQGTVMKLMATRVMGQDLLAEHSTLRIDRGSIDGVKKGQAVITNEGVVGYVFDVGTHSSRVLVLTDRYAVIDAILERSRARGIVEGVSVDRCRLKYLHRTDDVEPGDMVVTSGLDQVFPKGFPIGKVSVVETKKYGVTKRVEVVPIVDPSRVEEAFVVFKVPVEKPPVETASTKGAK